MSEKKYEVGVIGSWGGPKAFWMTKSEINTKLDERRICIYKSVYYKSKWVLTDGKLNSTRLTEFELESASVVLLLPTLRAGGCDGKWRRILTITRNMIHEIQPLGTCWSYTLESAPQALIHDVRFSKFNYSTRCLCSTEI